MEIISIIILPIIVLTIIIYGYKKKVNIYESFLKGVLEGLKTSLNIFPSILAMIFAVNIFIGSGLLNDMFKGAYGDIASMLFLRPISGNASLAIMNSIFEKFGPDSNMGRLASSIQGSTDTTFYVLALYFASIGIKKTRYALKVGLFADMIGILMSFILVYLFFGI